MALFIKFVKPVLDCTLGATFFHTLLYKRFLFSDSGELPTACPWLEFMPFGLFMLNTLISSISTSWNLLTHNPCKILLEVCNSKFFYWCRDMVRLVSHGLLLLVMVVR